MNWSDLNFNKEEKRQIFNEDARFRQELQVRNEVKYVLSMCGMTRIPNTVKHSVRNGFLSDYAQSSGTDHAIREYKWYAQKDYNIYFRYGCELIYFCMNPGKQPMVRNENGINKIVSPQTGDVSLANFLKGIKNSEKSISKDDIRQTCVFSDTMGYNFLRGKTHFLKRFHLEETKEYSITAEQLYFSYYIAWKGLSYNWNELLEQLYDKQTSQGSLNITKTGQDFLNNILFKHPTNMFKDDIEFDFIEYILFGYKEYRKKKEIDKTYFDILFFVFQRHPHTFPVFDTTFQNDKEKKGLLYQINYELRKLQKMTQPFIILDYSDYKELMKIQREIKNELETIIKHQNLSSGIKHNAERYLWSLQQSSVNNLFGNILICCRFDLIKERFQSIDSNKKTHFENMTHTIYRLWKKATADSPDVFSQYEDDEGRGLLDIEGSDADMNKPEIIIYETTEEINNNLFLFFRAAFPSVGFLNIIKEYLYTEPEGFRYDLYSYLESNETRSSKLQEIYISDLQNQGVTVNQKYKDSFNKKIRNEILLQLLAENIILYGPERLKNIFKKYFRHDNLFIDFIRGLIDDSFRAFERTLHNLSNRVVNSGKESCLRNEYHEVLYPNNKNMPPFIDELQLRKAVNEFCSTGGFRRLRNTCLMSFPCYQSIGWKDLLFREYIRNKKGHLYTETYFKKQIWEITNTINKEEIIRYGTV